MNWNHVVGVGLLVFFAIIVGSMMRWDRKHWRRMK